MGKQSRAGLGHAAKVPRVDRLVYFLRSRGVQVVVLALVANTMVAQLLYNSAGRLVLSSGLLFGYLIFSAACCSAISSSRRPARRWPSRSSRSRRSSSCTT